MSNMYACAIVPICSLFIVLSYLSILTKHTLSYQHNISTFISPIKISQNSDLSLCREKSLAAVEQEAHCNNELQHLGFPNLSQFVTVRTILATTSAPCLNQPNHKSQGKIHYSQIEPSRFSKCSQHKRITKPSLLVAMGFSLAAASAHVFHQLGIKP